MTRIPFPNGLEETEGLPKLRRRLENCYANGKGQVVPRPGIGLISQPGGVARGQFVFNNELYQVRSQALIRIADLETGDFEVIGPILGEENVETAIGFTQAVIVVKGGEIYALGDEKVKSGVLTVSDDGGQARFNTTSKLPSPGAKVIMSGFTEVSYNVTGIVTAVSEAGDTFSVTGVTDNSGQAQFDHASTSPAVGESVTLTGFTTATSYNGTFIVTASNATSFEVGVAFDVSDPGSFFETAGFSLGIAYVANDTGSFSVLLDRISDNPNFEPCVDVAFINGRFVYIPVDSLAFPPFFSDVNDAGSVQAESFFDAEELPDKSNSVFNLRNVLYIGGTDSFELFRDQGTFPLPFVRIPGTRLLEGYIGGKLEYNDTFLFIGRKKDQVPGIFAISAREAVKISNEAIDILLSKYDEEILAATISGRFVEDGDDIATFTFGNDSIGFFQGNWFVLSAGAGFQSNPWGAGFINQLNNTYFCCQGGRFGKLNGDTEEYGEPIARIIDTAIEQADNLQIAIQRADLGVSQGFNGDYLKDVTVMMAMSRDNVTYGPYVNRVLGKLGQYEQHLTWNPPGGLGSYYGFAGIRFYTTQPLIFSAQHLVMNVR